MDTRKAPRHYYIAFMSFVSNMESKSLLLRQCRILPPCCVNLRASLGSLASAQPELSMTESAFGTKSVHCECPLLGVKRTCHFALHMSAYDPKRTLGLRLATLAPDRNTAPSNVRGLTYDAALRVRWNRGLNSGITRLRAGVRSRDERTCATLPDPRSSSSCYFPLFSRRPLSRASPCPGGRMRKR